MKNVRMRVVIYHDDADGRCAAALAGRDALARGAGAVEYLPVENGDRVPCIESVGYDASVDDVWLVDFSFKVQEMIALVKAAGHGRLFWFDHHRTALDELNRFAFLPGRRQLGKAACMLVWRHIQPGVAAPWPVEYLADRDVWQFIYGDESIHFYEAYLAEPDSTPASELWDRYFNLFVVDEPALVTYLAKGEQLRPARMNQLREMVRRLGQDVVMVEHSHRERVGPEQRRYKVLRCNMPGSGDVGDLAHGLGYDAAWCWVRMQVGGKWVWKHSLYSKLVDVAYFCQQHGGGGHDGAAGFEEDGAISQCLQFSEVHYYGRLNPAPVEALSAGGACSSAAGMPVTGVAAG